MIANVGDLQRDIRREGVLDVQSPGPDERRREVAIHAKDRARVRCNWVAAQIAGADISIDRPGIPLARKDGEVACQDRAAARLHSLKTGWNGIESKAVVEREKRLPIHEFVEQTATSADYRLSRSPGIPCKPDARREVRVVAIVGRANLLAHLHEADLWIKVPEKVVLFLDDSVQLIAQPEVHRELFCQTD